MPSDDEWDKIDFSILKTANFEGDRIRAAAIKKKQRDDAEDAEWEKEQQERMKRDNEEFMRTVMDTLQDPIYDDEDEDNVPVKKALPARQLTRPVGTLTSRSAASALSQPRKAASIPSYAAPTAATKAKTPSSSALTHKKTPSTSSSNTIHASSYQTLGYAKGRAVSSTIRPTSTAANDRTKQTKPKRRDPLKELEELIQARELEEAGITMEDLDGFDGGGVSLAGEEEEEEEEVFQMKMPGA